MKQIKATKNYSYGAKAPDIEQEVTDAIYAAHRYRNRLCELELEKRKRHELLLLRLAPEYVDASIQVASAESELGRVREKIQAEKIKQRTKKPTGISNLTSEATAIRKRLKELRATRKSTKQAAYNSTDVKHAMAQNQLQHKEACAQAKRDSGLYWGTEALVFNSCKPFKSGSPPKFMRFSGEGQLAVQRQKGDNPIYLCYISDVNGKHAICNFRVASDPKGKPIFARVPIIFHRELPEGSSLKWAYLERRMMANKVKWKIRLTVDTTVDVDRDSNSWCAIHYGWTMQSSGLRVAIWQGSDGKQGAVVLPTKHCNDYARLDETKQARDVAFNTAVESLKEWLSDRDDIPEWLAEVKPRLHVWRAHGRLAGLVWRWRESRVDGDESIFNELEEWRKFDKHKWQHECRLSARVARRRKDLYRNVASQLSSQYGVLYAARIEVKKITQTGKPEDLEGDQSTVTRHSRWAAIASFHEILAEKFPIHTICVDPRDISRKCCNCGELTEPQSRKVQCRECGATWDIDENALANTIARGEAMQKSGVLLELQEEHQLKVKAGLEKLRKMQDGRRKKIAARKQQKKPL